MLVCHCRNVTDRQIKRAVREGASCSREVGRATGAGMRCGGCRSNVDQVVGDALSSEFEARAAASPAETLLPTLS